MNYNPKIHHRRSIRLQGYDYSQAGAYFVTICTQNRAHLFGKIADGEMVLNDAGEMVKRIWNEIPNDFINTALHEYVVMPNHFHGIIEIRVGADSISAPNNMDSISARNDADSISARNTTRFGGVRKGADMESAPTGTKTGMGTTIPNIIQSFKRHTTIRYIDGVKTRNWPQFCKKLWQRNYWEHIIRNENEYGRIAEYIRNNPAKWEMDKLNNGAGNRVMESQIIYNEEAWMV